MRPFRRLRAGPQSQAVSRVRSNHSIPLTMQYRQSNSSTVARSGGSLSARQWQDIRQAARLARSEGVTLAMHGVRISGGGLPAAAEQQQTARRRPLPGTGDGAQPMDLEGGATPTATRSTSKQLRDARKLEEFLERKRAERWLRFVQPLLKTDRWKHQQSVWTTWMRSRPSPKRDARRKLRDVFWRAWTRREHGSSTDDPVLGQTSWRDEYIRAKARLLCRRYIEPEVALRNLGMAPSDAVLDEMSDFGLSGFDPHDVQAAITASLRSASGEGLESGPPEDDTTARHPGGRQAGKSSLTQAGLTTPPSARANRKRGGRRR
jgi:hypothetical protein